jgi:hypothetical protein
MRASCRRVAQGAGQGIRETIGAPQWEVDTWTYADSFSLEANCHQPVLPDGSTGRRGREGGQAEGQRWRYYKAERSWVSLKIGGHARECLLTLLDGTELLSRVQRWTTLAKMRPYRDHRTSAS